MGQGSLDEKDKVHLTSKSSRRLTSVLAADLCGYSKLAEADEDNAIDILRAVRTTIETHTKEHRGRVFHIAADGFLVEFPSAQDCLEAALAIMTQFSGGTNFLSDNRTKLRIGLHVGDVVDQPDGDLLGHGVNVASRLQQNAQPGQIMASEHFVNLVASASNRKFVKLGTIQLKNIKEPITAFDVGAAPRRLSISKRIFDIKLLTSVGMAACLTVVLYLNFFHARDKTVDQRAIGVATEILTQTNLPVDAAISALIEHKDTKAAVQSILDEVESKQDELSVWQKTELLHQAGALAFNSDPETAQRIYRQIHANQKGDWVAMLQLARIHLTRSEKSEASRLLNSAYDRARLNSTQSLVLRIEQSRADAYPTNRHQDQNARPPNTLTYSQASDELSLISQQAKEAGLVSIGLRARSYAATYEFASLSEQEALTDEKIEKLIVEAKAIADEQSEYSSYLDLARTYGLLASLYLEIGSHSEALSLYESVLEMEDVLNRPEGRLHTMTNIASTYFWLGDFDRARSENKKAMAFGVREDLVQLIHFNKALSAEIEFADENNREGCRNLREAKSAWPPGRVWPDYLDELNTAENCFR